MAVDTECDLNTDKATGSDQRVTRGRWCVREPTQSLGGNNQGTEVLWKDEKVQGQCRTPDKGRQRSMFGVYDNRIHR